MLGVEDKQVALVCLPVTAGILLLATIGARDWLPLPPSGFAGGESIFWWIVVSTIVMEVGIGVSSKSLLAARLMAVESAWRSDRAVRIGRQSPLAGRALSAESIHNHLAYPVCLRRFVVSQPD
jgi:hypothetical protein